MTKKKAEEKTRRAWGELQETAKDKNAWSELTVGLSCITG